MIFKIPLYGYDFVKIFCEIWVLGFGDSKRNKFGLLK